VDIDLAPQDDDRDKLRRAHQVHTKGKRRLSQPRDLG
jgi:hypothetical protein